MLEQPDAFLLAAPVIFLGYAVYGLTGFGSTITALPLLAFFMPITTASPVMQVLDILAGFLVGVRGRKSADFAELARLAPFCAVGIVLGLMVFHYAPERALRLTLGVFLIAYSGWNFLRRAAGGPVSSRWAIPAGLSGGIFTALFGTGGPIYSVYLTRRLPDHRTFRASISLFILSIGVCRFSWFLSTGYYARTETLHLIIWCLPAMLCGLAFGSLLGGRVSRIKVLYAIWSVLAAAGLGLVIG
ncbi:sulfite exporter TauE/SafE family protein [Martelella lutilitoris]|uniref:Probable membrane transporter protein n=1 Tax=Martelella lutilitoris TaxID=2583532 RepID=A0A5C4JQR8_9HYPH|nr:sulfite exporter TauE/SafE family protein [Martelella lutilitoris]TNB47723.1 sulfite exporter TauE/SafE family protein [Martelella lutilitoris]